MLSDSFNFEIRWLTITRMIDEQSPGLLVRKVISCVMCALVTLQQVKIASIRRDDATSPVRIPNGQTELPR
jgi:hypothetical protein